MQGSLSLQVAREEDAYLRISLAPATDRVRGPSRPVFRLAGLPALGSSQCAAAGSVRAWLDGRAARKGTVSGVGREVGALPRVPLPLSSRTASSSTVKTTWDVKKNTLNKYQAEGSSLSPPPPLPPAGLPVQDPPQHRQGRLRAAARACAEGPQPPLPRGRTAGRGQVAAADARRGPGAPHHQLLALRVGWVACLPYLRSGTCCCVAGTLCAGRGPGGETAATSLRFQQRKNKTSCCCYQKELAARQ